jgi:hypothetical protein
MLEGWQVRIFVRVLEIESGNCGRQKVGIRTTWPNTPAWAGPISATLSVAERIHRSGRWKSSPHASR